MPRLADGEEHLLMLKQHGFAGVQGGDVALCRKLGLGVTRGGRVSRPDEADPFAKRCAEAGYDAATLHVGWGHESEGEADALIRAVLDAGQRYGIHLAIETHRATITQDSWRTVEFTKRFPEIRFNADYGHSQGTDDTEVVPPPSKTKDFCDHWRVEPRLDCGRSAIMRTAAVRWSGTTLARENKPFDDIVCFVYNVLQINGEDSMSKPISVRLPDELAKALGRVAHDTERSRSFVVQKAVESYLEDYADLQVAIDRLRDKADPVISSKDMRKSLGL